VLVGVSEAIRRDLRQYDVAARYGGEELVLLLPQTDAHGAEAVAQRYRHTIEALVVSSDTNEVRITASFGVAAFPEHPAESIDLLLDLADAALYESKRQGRNRVTLAQ
jgi:diguanylate cyclase (GGDEF)-like protein